MAENLSNSLTEVGVPPIAATQSAEERQTLAEPGRAKRVLLFFFSHRFLALARWEFHFVLLRFRNAVTFQQRRIASCISTRPRPLYLNFGSGPRGLDSKNWLNVDGYTDRNVHFVMDLSRRIAVPQGTFDGIFCEHVFEHFTEDEGNRVVREFFRILRPGCHLRVIVPDAERILRWYFEQPDCLAARRECGTAMESVNSYFRQRYEHQFMYDWQTLCQTLRQAGFTDVERTCFRSGAFPALSGLDDAKYEAESLYVEAVKPA